MPALYPVSVAPEDYKIGDNVKWYTSESSVSPYVGKVVAISPKINKVWVTWPIGDTKQHNPEELILIPKYQGMSVVTVDNGYDSYDKQKSEEGFGTLSPEIRTKMAGSVTEKLKRYAAIDAEMDQFKIRCANLHEKFSERVSSEIVDFVSVSKEAGKNELETYSAAYDKFASVIGDDLVRIAIAEVYA